MEMKNAIAREGREAKNLLLYHLSSEDDLTQSKYTRMAVHVVVLWPPK